MSISEKRKESQDIIDSLYAKYETDQYMLERTHRYIVTQLPILLENMKANYLDRCSRISEKTSDQEKFIQSFLTANQYFYVSSTENFFYYDKLHYQFISEDDIIYYVLSSISRDGNLMSWKQKTKINIMKRIKEENPLLKSIPESATIQHVLSLLCPLLFSSRNEAKYFLTVLGDNIHRKNTHLIHFIHPKAKFFIRELNNICQIYIGTGLSQTFRHKYHDHDYENCRIIKINETVKSESIWHEILKQSVLDIICIACHYSSRYGSSEEFVSDDEELAEGVFYLKNSHPSDLVSLFMREYLDISISMDGTRVLSHSTSPEHEFFIEQQMDPGSIRQITWKNMQYLWRHFLDSKQLPALLFFGTLKTHLMEKLVGFYKEEKDSFVGICSKYLPSIQNFLEFWNDTITIDEEEMDFEIEELMFLYKQWCPTITNITSKQILDIITYFFPMIEILQEKFVSHIRCSLWDKGLDIKSGKPTVSLITGDTVDAPSLPSNILSLDSSSNHLPAVSINDAYLSYCKYHRPLRGSGIKKLLVSKSYFEKYVSRNPSVLFAYIGAPSNA